jgi:hypothetical protein
VDRVVASELRPCAVASRLRHEAIENHARTASQFFEVSARGDQELRHVLVIVSARNNIERVRVDVLVEVLAHDERVTERAKVGLEICDRLLRERVGQHKLEMPVEPGDKWRRIVADSRREIVDCLTGFDVRYEPRRVAGEIAVVTRGHQWTRDEL